MRRRWFPPSIWVAAPMASNRSVVFGPPPIAYRVTYRVESGNPFGSVVRTETLEVSRPWQSRLTTRKGAPPGRSVTDVRVGDFGALDVRTPGQVESVLVLAPDLAPSDLRLDADRRALVRAGAIKPRERRVVLRRPCQVYRSNALPQGQNIGPVSERSDDIVDSCVDRDGIVLEQIKLYKGKLLLRRRAVSVNTSPHFASGRFAITKSSTVPLSLGGGNVTRVDPAEGTQTPGTTNFFLDAVPDGFVYQGHYVVVPSTAPAGALPQNNRRAGFVDVWVRGIDVLVLDQSGLAYGGDALGELPLATTVDAGPLGQAVAVPGARLSQVAVRLPGGRYVRVLGTLGVERLTSLLRTVRRVDNP